MTEIFVFWLITSPFWPTISVGMISVPLQRFPFAVSAGYSRRGSSSSKFENGSERFAGVFAAVVR